MIKKISGFSNILIILTLAGTALFSPAITAGQTLTQKLQKAFLRFEEDSQLSHAISSLYVIDAASGKVIFDKNSRIGLAPASTQKVITSAATLTLLGKDFRYTTSFATGSNAGNAHTLYILPSGDPTLGSERWEYTKADKILNGIIHSLGQTRNISKIVIDNRGWAFDHIPDGWIWQDIGNYYGAGCEKLNWRENQYDLLLQSGKSIGDTVRITGTHPKIYGHAFRSAATSAAKGTGDNAYIYFPLNDTVAVVKGTIPVNENGFGISGAFASGTRQFAAELADKMLNVGISGATPEISMVTTGTAAGNYTVVHTETSPPLDSLIYWFNKKSINLYGEALLKTIGDRKKGYGITDTGVTILKDFWQQQGIDAAELNIVDGSGLSPLNRVTSHSQVQVLQYAREQSWFDAFYHSLPVYNGMKMKSGTIRNVKGFTGYHTAGGKTYIFSFLVNNYNGSTAGLVRKMYTVLDVLK